MRSMLIVSALALAGYAASANAQAAIKPSDAAGTWASKSMVGPKDSVITQGRLAVTADGKGWTLTYPNHDPIALRVVTTGGDSIVTEAGPYPSIVRPGQTVTLLRIVGHYKGNTMWGTFEAHYSTGDVLHGKTTATREK